MRKMLRDLLLAFFVLPLAARALDDSNGVPFEDAGKDGVVSNE